MWNRHEFLEKPIQYEPALAPQSLGLRDESRMETFCQTLLRQFHEFSDEHHTDGLLLGKHGKLHHTMMQHIRTIRSSRFRKCERIESIFCG